MKLVDYLAAQIETSAEDANALMDEDEAAIYASDFVPAIPPVYNAARSLQVSYIAWLKATGRYVPLTNEQKALRADIRAMRKLETTNRNSHGQSRRRRQAA